RREQEARYAESDITPEFLRNELRNIQYLLEQKKHLDFEKTFYVGSSDPLEDMEKSFEDVRGKRVTTVAGAGDFPLMFMNHGASRVDIFDVSPFAAFWTELKLQAACTFSYENYKHFFGNSDDDSYRSFCNKQKYPYLQTTELFDPAFYPALRQHLTKQARTYFDLLQEPEFRNLFSPPKDADRYHHFAKKRGDGFVGGCVESPQAYRVLQERVRSTPWTISVQNLEEAAHTASAPDDIFYLSNIGIDARDILGCARRVHDAGYRHVIMSFLNEAQQFGYPVERSRRYFLYEDESLGDHEIGKDPNKKQHSFKTVSTLQGIPLAPGSIINLKLRDNTSQPVKVLHASMKGQCLVGELVMKE
ncbi:MAG: DUF3419 family protein, partial [Methylococcaceae bacterium]